MMRLGILIVATLSLMNASCPPGDPGSGPAPYDCDAPPAQTGLIKVKVKAPSGKYIVVLVPSHAKAFEALGGQAFTSAAADIAGKVAGVKVHRTLSRIGAFVAIASETQARLLAKDPSVQYVQEDGVKSIPPLKSTGALAEEPWGVKRIAKRNLPIDSSAVPRNRGKGVVLASLDTGVDCGNAAFKDAAGQSRCRDGKSAFGSSTDDDHGHGTHTTGTMAGNDPYGIASEALVLPLKGLNSQGSGSDSGLVELIDYAIDYAIKNNLQGRLIMNISLGGGPAPALDDAICRAVKAGILPSIAAGNDNLNACNYSPSRVKQALTVGATTIDDRMTSFSNTGAECIDLFAPGQDILSVVPGGKETMSGTSMAAPHAAGTAAVVASEQPAPTVVSIMAAVLDTATKDVLSGVIGPNLLVYDGPLSAAHASVWGPRLSTSHVERLRAAQIRLGQTRARGRGL